MMVVSVLLFAVVTFLLSFLIGNAGVNDKGKAASLVTLVAWGSLIAGLYIAKM